MDVTGFPIHMNQIPPALLKRESHDEHRVNTEVFTHLGVYLQVLRL
jgi:hypothetical protein